MFSMEEQLWERPHAPWAAAGTSYGMTLPAMGLSRGGVAAGSAESLMMDGAVIAVSIEWTDSATRSCWSAPLWEAAGV
jgi:hypothetical protein